MTTRSFRYSGKPIDMVAASARAMSALRPIGQEITLHEFLAILILEDFWRALKKSDAAGLEFAREALPRFRAFEKKREQMGEN